MFGNLAVGRGPDTVVDNRGISHYRDRLYQLVLSALPEAEAEERAVCGVSGGIQKNCIGYGK